MGHPTCAARARVCGCCSMVLARHNSNAKLLRLYALFLQDVRNDPWSAAKWFS